MIDVFFIKKPQWVAFISIYHEADRPDNSSAGFPAWSDVMYDCWSFISDEKMQSNQQHITDKVRTLVCINVSKATLLFFCCLEDHYLDCHPFCWDGGSFLWQKDFSTA